MAFISISTILDLQFIFNFIFKLHWHTLFIINFSSNNFVQVWRKLSICVTKNSIHSHFILDYIWNLWANGKNWMELNRFSYVFIHFVLLKILVIEWCARITTIKYGFICFVLFICMFHICVCEFYIGFIRIQWCVYI